DALAKNAGYRRARASGIAVVEDVEFAVTSTQHVPVPVLAGEMAMPNVRRHAVKDRHRNVAGRRHCRGVAPVEAVDVKPHRSHVVRSVGHGVFPSCGWWSATLVETDAHCIWSNIAEIAAFSRRAFLISSAVTYGHSPYSRKLGHWCSRTNLMNALAFVCQS